MEPIRIDPQRAFDEALRAQQKLASSLNTLREVEDVDFGVTDKEAIFTDDKVVVYRYKGDRKPTAKAPLLICYALVNRPYMVDLQDDRSMVKNLLALGEDVYIIDWGYPDRSDRWLTMDDYINGYIRRCVAAVARHAGVKKINLLGICEGGAFSLCFTALHQDMLQNLITMVTPVDFHTSDNMLSHWTRDIDIDLFVDTLGNVSADTMNWCYLTLKPVRLNQQKYVALLDILDDKEEVESFLRMEKWIFDSPDQAGEAFRQFIKDFYQGNKLVKGGLKIGEHDVSLKNITIPVLNIFAKQDHLVPPDAARALREQVGTRDYTELEFPGGHIGIYVSGRAQRQVPSTIHEWLSERTR